MLQSQIAIVDIETTGTAATADRITEIAIMRVVDGRTAEEWSTLINPECAIPGEIQALTGITDAMVRNAPTFGEIQDEIMARLAGHLFVAHNARFDYGFVKNAFRRLGISFTADVLCTVRLSRRLYPQYSRHNLDTLVARHELPASDRHRALGDVRIVWRFLETVKREKGADEIDAAFKALLKMPSLPRQLAPGALDALPDGPGVYVFYGVNNLPIYIGKSVNLRDRVRSHFSGDHRSSSDLRISMEITRIDFEETAGDLGALIREAQLVKTSTPLHNRRLRKNQQIVFVRVKDLESVPEMLSVTEIDFDDLDGLFGPFPAKARARALLHELAAEHGLCWSVLGAQKIGGACFARQIKRCRGACVGAESIVQHNLRLIDALGTYRVRPWPYPGPVGLAEVHPDHGWKQVHVIDRWCHIGTAKTEQDVHDLLEESRQLQFDPDIYKILRKYFASGKSVRPLMKIPAVESELAQ